MKVTIKIENEEKRVELEQEFFVSDPYTKIVPLFIGALRGWGFVISEEAEDELGEF